MRISDWSSDVCSSDLPIGGDHRDIGVQRGEGGLHVRILQRNRRAHLYAPLFRLRMHGGGAQRQIGRASCRERVCQYVSISVVALSLKKKNETSMLYHIVRRTNT